MKILMDLIMWHHLYNITMTTIKSIKYENKNLIVIKLIYTVNFITGIIPIFSKNDNKNTFFIKKPEKYTSHYFLS